MSRNLLMGAGILALLLWAYGSHATAQMVYEDARWDAAATSSAPLSLRRPLMLASWRWQMAHTPNPFAFHAVNLALHGCVGLLVGLFAFRLGLSRLAAWFAAALVLLHPLSVESAAYASARPELFAAIGVLGACLSATGRSPWRWGWMLAAILFGLAGKESAALVFVLIPLTLWAMRRDWRIPAAIGAIALSAVIASIGVRALIDADFYSGEIHGWDWLLIQSAAAHRLLTVWVTGLGMTVDYDYDALSLTTRLIGLTALSLITVGAYGLRVPPVKEDRSDPCLCGADERPDLPRLDLVCPKHDHAPKLVGQRRDHRLISFGLGMGLIAILPRLLVQTPRSYLNEHQFLLPMIGFSFAAVAFWDTWSQPAT